MIRPLLIVLAVFVALACGSNSPASSGRPGPEQRAPVLSRADPSSPYTLTGVVRDAATGRGIEDAIVRSIDGPNANKGASTDENGYYQITDLLVGDLTINVTADDYVSADQDVVIDGNTRVDVTLNPTDSES